MILFRKAVFEDYFKILSLADSQLGEGYIKGVLKFTHENPIWVAEFESSHQIVGFVYVVPNGTIAIIKSIAVKQEFQNRGIGTDLIKNAIGSLKDRFEKFEVLAWERSDTMSIPLERLLRRIGFTKGQRKPQYWYEDSIKRGYQCPACGNPCKCDAVLFSIPSFYFSTSID